MVLYIKTGYLVIYVYDICCFNWIYTDNWHELLKTVHI